MTSYRGYAIRSDGRIKRGAYLEARTDPEAQAAAADLCDEDVDHIEVWAGAVKVDEVECHDPDGSSGGSSASASAS